jgi:hypothetical protein
MLANVPALSATSVTISSHRSMSAGLLTRSVSVTRAPILTVNGAVLLVLPSVVQFVDEPSADAALYKSASDVAYFATPIRDTNAVPILFDPLSIDADTCASNLRPNRVCRFDTVTAVASDSLPLPPDVPVEA